MGVDTKAILRKGTTIEQIVTRLEKKYGEVAVQTTHDTTLFKLIFKEPSGVYRNMCVFLSNCAKHDYQIDGVLLNLSYWGSSIEIMKWLLDEFGGYLDEKDCDDKGFYRVKNVTEIRDTKLKKVLK